MFDMTKQWKSITDRGAWAARGSAFVTKVKATKAVWFAPNPASKTKSAKKAAKRATKKTARTSTKTSRSAGKKAAAATK